MSPFQNRPVYFSYLSTGKNIHGIFLSRKREDLDNLRKHFENALIPMGERCREVRFTNIETINEHSRADKNVLDACQLVRNSDTLYLPVSVVERGNVCKIFPPHFYRLTLVELINRYYVQCKVDDVLRAAIVCDLALHANLA